MKRKSFFLISLLVLLILTGVAWGFFYFQKNILASPERTEDPDGSAKTSDYCAPSPVPTTTDNKPQNRTERIKITPEDTYSSLMEKAGLGHSRAMDIYHTVKPDYDLAQVRCGRFLELTFTPEDELKKLQYNINNQEKLTVTASSSTSTSWQSQIEPIPYEVKTAVATGTVTSSMYRAAQNKDIDIRTIVKLADAFQWTVDFAMEARKGDTFKFVYEKKYLDGEYVRPGRILAAQYVNAGEKYEIYYYEESEENKGYFNPEGKSAQKMFLKAPVAYKHISSGYTTGPRYLSKFSMYTSSHKAIDYAAESGTPIRAVGNGVVTKAGWNSAGYGYLTAIRHNSTYTTRYAHQSRIIVSPGERVKQGEVIGYVGNTGLSTGPHLHYGMIKHGQKINPLNLELPPSKSISDENMDKFQKAIAPYQKMLNR